MKVLTAQRDAISRIASNQMESVESVRRAFTNGTAPVQTVNSGSAAEYIRSLGQQVSAPEIVSNGARFGLLSTAAGNPTPLPRPEIDSVEIANDTTYGMLDSFYTRVRISIAAADISSISTIRILRSQTETPAEREPDAPSVTMLIDGAGASVPRKSSDKIFAQASQAAQIGRGNSLTESIAEDPFAPQRNVIANSSLREPPPVPNNNRTTSSPSALVSIKNADRSVLEDVVFSNNRRSFEGVAKPEVPLRIGRNSGVSVLPGRGIGTSGDAVELANSALFREVGQIPVAASIVRRVGDFIELDFYDPTVIFGATYTYTAIARNLDGIDGPRSRLVSLTILRQNPPATPSVLYSFVAGVPQFMVRCSGQFLDHVEVFRRGARRRVKPTRRLGTQRGIVSSATPPRTATGFIHADDVPVALDGSASYADRDVVPGEVLDYRFYVVDSFGNKSQTPFTCTVTVPAPGETVPLSVPTIVAEQGVGGRNVNIRVHTDDPNVTSFIVARREVGNFESSYRQPSEPDYVNLGTSDEKRAGSRQGPHLVNIDRAWTGFLRSSSGSARMVDTVVGFDRTYQYTVQSVDRRGRRSSHGHSSYVFVADRPVIDSPTSFTGTILSDESGAPTGAMLSWQGGTFDFSPNDMLGDQDVLNAYSVRSVFQVERRDVGGVSWEALPPTTASYFIDPVMAGDAPSFRPTYPKVLREYDYRVIAMQSGGLISNYTDPVRLSFFPNLVPPITLWVRSTGMAVDPASVIVSWDYDGEDVDGWEIERAVTNKIYASQIPSINSAEARGLEYVALAHVMRESSRAQSISSTNPVPPEATGNRFLIDGDVSPENSYFYRVRATRGNSTSDWTYGGVILTNSPTDRKIASLMSDEDRRMLSRTKQPIGSIGSRKLRKGS